MALIYLCLSFYIIYYFITFYYPLDTTFYYIFIVTFSYSLDLPSSDDEHESNHGSSEPSGVKFFLSSPSCNLSNYAFMIYLPYFYYYIKLSLDINLCKIY